MINLTVKTLDSQNHAFSLNDDITVKQFKEHIASTVNIPVDLQRLIYCGRVLQDEKNLSEYDVNGKVIHLVQRAPPSVQQRSQNAGQIQSRDSHNGEHPSSPRLHYRQAQFHGNPMYVGSVSIPADVLEGHGEWQIPQLSNTFVSSHLTVVRNMLGHANRVIDRLENPTTTSSANATNSTSAAAQETQSTHENGREASTAVTASNETPSTQEPAEPVAGSSAEPPNANEALVPRQMAELLERLLKTQDRLAPYIRNRILTSISQNADENQRIMDGVSECLHFLSHAQHALSDFNIDMQQTPPRTLRCRPIVIQPSTILQAGLPIQVEAHISLHGQADNNNTENDSSSSNLSQTTSVTTATTATPSESSTSRSTSNRPQNSTTERQVDPPFNPVFNFPSNQVEVVMEMGPQTPRVWSFSSGSHGTNNNNDSNTTGNTASTGNTNNNTNNNSHTSNNNPNNNSTTGTTTNGFPWGAAPSPDIIRNLMQAVAGYMAQTSVAMPAPSTAVPSSTALTSAPTTNLIIGRRRGRTGDVDDSATPLFRSNTDTHPTTSTQTRTTSRTHVFHQHAQALGVGVNVGHSLDFDPFLPCNSQHIRRQQQNQTGNAASTQTGQASSGADTSAQSGPILNATAGPRFTTITGVQIVNSNFNGPSLAEGIANAERQNRTDRVISFNDFLTNRDIHLFPRDGVVATGGERFYRIRGRSVFERIYLILSKLSIHEWRLIINGDYSPLTAVIQQSLQTGFREVCPTASEANLPREIAQSVINELRHHIERTFDGENARDDNGVEFLMRDTIEKRLKIHIVHIVRTICTPSETSQDFGESVSEHIKALINDLVGICRLALRGGQDGFERVIARFGSLVTRDTNEVFRQWILGTVVEWICTYSQNVKTSDKEDIKKLLIRKNQAKSSSKQSEMKACEAASAASPDVAPQSHAEPMETDSGTDPLMLDSNEVVSTTFPGHENLLSDWVPIIARDGARQRRQLQLGLSGGSVTTLSDAYLATMPSKRRKLVEQQKPTLLVSPTSNSSAIPASMERLIRDSVGRAGMEQVDGAAAAVAADSNVRLAFGQAIRECLHPHRYQTPDFPDPLRFPNSTKFFNNKEGPDKQ